MPETGVIDDRWIRSVRHHIEAIRDEVKAKALQEFAYELSLMASQEPQDLPGACGSNGLGCRQAGAFNALGRAAEAARARADDLLAGRHRIPEGLESRTSPDDTGCSRAGSDGGGQERTLQDAAEQHRTEANR
jgi:hypothetical protein